MTNKRDDDIERAHDPYWFTDKTAAFPDYESGPANRTDYNFPPEWGLWSDEQKIDWFLEMRVRDQMERQHDAGMWNQFDKFDLEEAKTFTEAWQETDKNPFRHD